MTTARPRPASLPRAKQILKDLQRLPSVGPSIADDLYLLGIRSVKQLALRDPEALYERHCVQKGMTVDRCVLYSFRCAVYAARTERPRQELLLWWNWKDRPLPRRRRTHRAEA